MYICNVSFSPIVENIGRTKKNKTRIPKYSMSEAKRQDDEDDDDVEDPLPSKKSTENINKDKNMNKRNKIKKSNENIILYDEQKELNIKKEDENEENNEEKKEEY